MPADPQVIQYLQYKCNEMFLEWDLTVRFYVRQTFLGMENQKAFDIVTENQRAALPALSARHQVASLYSTPADRLPQRYRGTLKRDEAAKLYPFRSLLARSNVFPNACVSHQAARERCRALRLPHAHTPSWGLAVVAAPNGHGLVGSNRGADVVFARRP